MNVIFGIRMSRYLGQSINKSGAWRLANGDPISRWLELVARRDGLFRHARFGSKAANFCIRTSAHAHGGTLTGTTKDGFWIADNDGIRRAQGACSEAIIGAARRRAGLSCDWIRASWVKARASTRRLFRFPVQDRINTGEPFLQ